MNQTSLTRWVSASATCFINVYSIPTLGCLLLIFCRFNAVRQQSGFARPRNTKVLQCPFSYVASLCCKILEDFGWWGVFPPMIFDLICTVSWSGTEPYITGCCRSWLCSRQIFVVYRFQLKRHRRLVVLSKAKFLRQLPPSHSFG